MDTERCPEEASEAILAEQFQPVSHVEVEVEGAAALVRAPPPTRTRGVGVHVGFLHSQFQQIFAFDILLTSQRLRYLNKL